MKRRTSILSMIAGALMPWVNLESAPAMPRVTSLAEHIAAMQAYLRRTWPGTVVGLNTERDYIVFRVKGNSLDAAWESLEFFDRVGPVIVAEKVHRQFTFSIGDPTAPEPQGVIDA